MTDRTVSVKLRMTVREYLDGGRQAIDMNNRLKASQAELAGESKRASAEFERLAKSMESSGRSAGRGGLYAAAGVAALGATGGALKALPPLLTATATGLAVLPVALGSTVVGMGVAYTATRGLGDAFKELSKHTKQNPLSKLAPEARQLVGEYARLRPQLSAIQQELQGRAFTGTAAGLNLLVTKTLPQVTGGLERIADDWSDLFAELALATNQPEVVGAFNAVTASADEFFDGVTARIRPTAAAIATLVSSTDPVARAFGDELLSWLDSFNAGVERAASNGSLQELFESGTHAAQELMSISQSVLQITGMVVREASATNDATGQAGNALRAYIASGRAAGDVAGVVHTLTVAWEGLRDVLGPIAGLARDALADPGTAATVGQFFAILAAGSQVLVTLLEVLLAVNGATGGVLLALVAVAIAATKMGTAIGLANLAAAKGAVSLAAYGAAGARAGTALVGLVGVAGKVAGALLGLQIAHQIFDSFQDGAANVDALDASLQKLAQTGEYVGELQRVFDQGWGDIAAQGMLASTDNWFGNFIRSAEEAIPLAGDLAEMLGSPTFVNSARNFADLDAAVVRYAQSTGDLTGANRILTEVQAKSGLEWEELRRLLPGAYAELEKMQLAAHQAANGQAQLAARTKLLAAPIQEAVNAGRDLLGVFDELNGGSISFGKAQVQAEKAARGLKEALKENGRSFDVYTEKGLANKEALLGYVEAAAKAAQAKQDETGSVEKAAGVYDAYIQRLRSTLAAQGMAPASIDAIISKYAEMPTSLQQAGEAVNTLNSRLRSIPKGTTFRFNGDSVVDAQGNVIELAAGIKGLPVGKTFRWNGNSLVDGQGKVYALKKAVQGLPASKTIDIRALTGNASSRIQAIKDSLARLSNKTITITARTQIPAGMSVRQLMNAHGGVYVPRQRGGATVAAAGGLLQPEIAPPGTRYQWAEPETGGELFLPRRGINVARGRALLGVAAEWYGMRMQPMRHGGWTAAASGLVNVAPTETTTTTTTRATRLDSAEAYIQARNAVASLSKALKENGRSFSTATVKGRENRSAVYSAIRAAQDAAKTKFEETGSIAAANKAYDEHIARLKATLQQQKVNSSTIKALLSAAQRPTYDVPTKPAAAPTNSAGNIAAAKATIATLGGLEELRDQLSLNRAGVDINTDFGRENLGNIIAFLETAAAMAQARFEQTKNAKTATADYDKQIAALRVMLQQSGYPASTISSLISTYGRITLVPNRIGGVYAAAGLARLNEAQMFAGSGATMYGFAEPGTGGEAFIPRFGDRQRGRDLLDVAAGWYGGRFTVGGGGSTQTTVDQSTHLTVQPLSYNPTTAELIGYQREIDARARVGRPR